MSRIAFDDEYTIKNVRFKNRILRSSIGGRTSNYDGTVTDVWKNFEKRFADGDVGGIISTTFHVNKDRVSPPQYPSIAEQKYVPYLKKYIEGIKRDRPDCRYLIQIGDPGYSTYTSLVPEDQDAKSSAAGFDFAFGYGNRRLAMTGEEIEQAISDYADAAERVRASGADGLEITATKGYLIHQFLNPGINRRTDAWGGDPEKRFRFLDKTVDAVRSRVGTDYLVGIRLSAADFNYSPLQFSLFRFPWASNWREQWFGNDETQMLEYARRLCGRIDFLHIVSGFGFPNPRDTPGAFPTNEIKMFFNSTRHLSGKAAMRASLFNALPDRFAHWLMNQGWKYQPGINLEFARRFKNDTGMPVIVNGGFQERSLIEDALSSGGCDMVSMARALIANPNLIEQFTEGRNAPDRPCTYCNKCVGRTPTSPLGCYEPSRFASQKAMVDQILEWNRPDPA